MIKSGPAFSDSLIVNRSSRRRSYSSVSHHIILELFPLLILVGIFSILFLRLFYLQIVRGAYYKNLSDGNRTRKVTISAPRGVIFDRNRRPLVRNIPAYKILKDKKLVLLNKDEALKLMTTSQKNSIELDTQRQYLYNDIFAHVLGYTGQIDEAELKSPKYKDYQATDFVGKMGLEASYESMLRGQKGEELYEVDANGAMVRKLGTSESIPGSDLFTTLDIDLQRAVADAFSDVKKGAAVISDPSDGSILALYSKPSFDPNLFTHSSSYKGVGDYSSIESLLTDTSNQPFLDRAISGLYPPGSTYKLVIASAALQSQAIKSDTQIEDTGILKIGSFSFGNWYYLSYGKKEGMLNVVKAIKRSNDIFFYKAAEATGVEKIKQMSKLFGLGNTLGIDLPTEKKGVIPDPSWKEKTIGEPWYLGDIYNLGIGQGYLLITPLQVNFWTSIFANGGVLYKPHVIAKEKEVIRRNFVSPENIALIREGMRESCNTGGAAWPLFDFKVKNDKLPLDGNDFSESASDSGKMVRVALGCKTGTAESGGTKEPHAWISVIAPYYKPEIVVTILVETSGEGSNVAAPIAKKILEKYFQGKKK